MKTRFQFPFLFNEAVAVETPGAAGGGGGNGSSAAQTAFLGASPAAGGASAHASPAPSPAGFFGEHIQEGGKFKEGWTSSIAEKHPQLANQLMRYATEADAFTGLENLVKAVGKKTVGAAYPKAGATEAEIAAYRTDAGVPTSAEDYKLKPDKLPDGIGWDEETGRTFSELMHKHHIPAAAAKELVAVHLENVASQAAGGQQAAQARLEEMVQHTTTRFQKEWGVDFQSRVDANNDFVTARFTDQDLADPVIMQALSHPAVVRIVDEARRASREAPLPGGNNTVATGSMSPRQQALEIITANKNWRQDPALSARVNDLYGQQAAADKRKTRP